ncbi:MAG: hypothetical protein ACE5MI_14810 [Acidimicrobiia bacterium]
MSTAATLPHPGKSKRRKVPPLPPLDDPTEQWHPEVISWWTEVWRSPMAAEFLDSDVRGELYALARLYQRFWKPGLDVRELCSLFHAIQKGGQSFGLTPIDRRRLQWEIEKGEEAADRTKKRRQAKKAAKRQKDPRKGLKLA